MKRRTFLKAIPAIIAAPMVAVAEIPSVLEPTAQYPTTPPPKNFWNEPYSEFRFDTFDMGHRYGCALRVGNNRFAVPYDYPVNAGQNYKTRRYVWRALIDAVHRSRYGSLTLNNDWSRGAYRSFDSQFEQNHPTVEPYPIGTFPAPR